MTTHPTRRHELRLSDVAAIPHSGMCDAGRISHHRTAGGWLRPVQAECTCAAGLLRLMAGAQ